MTIKLHKANGWHQYYENVTAIEADDDCVVFLFSNGLTKAFGFGTFTELEFVE